MNQPVTVLLVGESPVSFELVERTMQKHFVFKVFTATDAKIGTRVAEEQLPAIIMCDYDALGVDAASFCRRVKLHLALKHSMLVLFIAATESRNEVESLGADEYISKPISLREFVARFQAVLRIKALQDQVREENDELARLNQKLEEGFHGALKLINQVAGLRVPNASARAERAANIARWMGQKLQMDAEELRLLEIAARLHELGKISLSDDLLRKDRGQRNQQEDQTFNQFPILGQVLIAGIPQLVTVSRYIRHQLENYDGTGYPDRLMKSEIPLASRVLRAVNALEELPSGHGAHLEQVQSMQKIQGTVLEPQIVQLLIEYLTVTDDPDWMRGKRQVNVEELTEGMVLAADIITGSGVKLLPKDSTLSTLLVRRIQTHQAADPIINAIYVYDSPKAPSLHTPAGVAL